MSEWRERANKRRDARRTALPVIRPPSGSQKDTKKWCRGKVGRTHTPKCVSFSELKGSPGIYRGWKVLVCAVCGRHLDYFWPSPWRTQPQQPPSWAVD